MDNFRFVEQSHMVEVIHSPYVVLTDYVEVKDIPIEVWRHSHAPDKLIAIHPDVKQELMSLRDPDLMESITKEHNRTIQVMKSQRRNQEDLLNKMIDERDKDLTTIKSASLWQRIKWVFTGVYLCKTS